MTINESVIRRLIAHGLGKEVQTTDRQNQNQTDSKQGTLKALAGRVTQRRPATIVLPIVADLFSRLPKFDFQRLRHGRQRSIAKEVWIISIYWHYDTFRVSIPSSYGTYATRTNAAFRG